MSFTVNNVYQISLMNPRHLGTGHFGTDLDISVLDTGQFGTWMTQYSVLTTIVWYLLIVNIFVLVHVVL
jgi:hypothetical protein